MNSDSSYSITNGRTNKFSTLADEYLKKNWKK